MNRTVATRRVVHEWSCELGDCTEELARLTGRFEIPRTGSPHPAVDRLVGLGGEARGGTKSWAGPARRPRRVGPREQPERSLASRLRSTTRVPRLASPTTTRTLPARRGWIGHSRQERPADSEQKDVGGRDRPIPARPPRRQRCRRSRSRTRPVRSIRTGANPPSTTARRRGRRATGRELGRIRHGSERAAAGKARGRVPGRPRTRRRGRRRRRRKDRRGIRRGGAVGRRPENAIPARNAPTAAETLRASRRTGRQQQHREDARTEELHPTG